MEGTGLVVLIGIAVVLVMFALAFVLVKLPLLLLRSAYLVFPQWRVRKEASNKANEVAIGVCKRLFPDEPIHGASICNDEPERYVVRVFYGTRDTSYKLPPWRACLIVGVGKESGVGEVIEDGKGRYRPVVR